MSTHASLTPDWSAAYSENHVFLVRVATRIVGPDHSEDVVQHVFMNAIRFNSFKGNSSLRTWLCRITINVALMHRRSGGKMRQGEITLDEAIRIPTHNPTALELSVKNAALARVLDIVRTLSPRRQEVLKLKMQGHTNKEVADAMGLTVGAVKCHHHRALLKLRENIEAERV